MMTAKHKLIIIFIISLTSVLFIACTSPEPVDEESIVTTRERTHEPMPEPTPEAMPDSAPILDDNGFVSTFEAVGSRFSILEGWIEVNISGRATVVREDNHQSSITFNVVNADGQELDTFVDMIVELDADTEGYILLDRRSIDIGEHEGVYLCMRYLFNGDTELFVHNYIVVQNEIAYVLVYLAPTHPDMHLAEVEIMAFSLEID